MHYMTPLFKYEHINVPGYIYVNEMSKKYLIF